MRSLALMGLVALLGMNSGFQSLAAAQAAVSRIAYRPVDPYGLGRAAVRNIAIVK